MSIYATQLQEYSEEEKKIRNTKDYVNIKKFLDENILHFVDKKSNKPQYFINLNTRKANANGKHRRMRVPISLYVIENKEITFKCPHVTLDLYDILIKKNGQNQLEQGLIKCDTCKILITDYKMLRINQQLYNIIKKVNCRTIYVSQIFDHTFHFYHDKKQAQQIQLLNQNLDLLKNCLRNIISFENVIQQYVQMKGHLLQNKIITLYSLCLYSGLKISIPVRFVGCTHLELYDFVGVLMMIEYYKGVEYKKQKVLCYHPQCSNMIDVNNPDIQFDAQVHELIMKSLPYSFIFQQSPYNIKVFEDIKYDIQHFNDFDLIKLYQKELNCDISQKEKNKEQLNQFLKRCYQIMNKDISQETEQTLRYSTYEVDYYDTKYDILIQYPARCQNCPLTKIADLRVFILLYHKAEATKFDVLQCPSCGSVIKVKEFSDYVYFDRFLCLYQCQNQIEINKNKKLHYNKDNLNLKNQLIKRQFTNLQDQIQRFQQTQVNRYGDYEVSKVMELNFPIGSTKCKTNEFKDIERFKNNKSIGELKVFDCQYCKLQTNRLMVQDLYNDSTIKEMVTEKQVPIDDLTFKQNSLQVLKQQPLIQPRLQSQGSLDSPLRINYGSSSLTPNSPGTPITPNSHRLVQVQNKDGQISTMTVREQNQQQPQIQQFEQYPNPQLQQQQSSSSNSSSNSKIKLIATGQYVPNKK